MMTKLVTIDMDEYDHLRHEARLADQTRDLMADCRSGKHQGIHLWGGLVDIYGGEL